MNGSEEGKMAPTTIRVRRRGPLLVEGSFEVYDADGSRIALPPGKKVLLCRCGASKTRPLCDGSHNRVGFEAPKRSEAAAREQSSAPEPLRRRSGDVRPDPQLWEALEHGQKLMRILSDFYDRVYRDPQLSPFFEGVTKQRAIEKQYNFLRQKFTGDKCYFGDRPRNAHHWMVVSEELFDHRERLMEDCIRRAGVPEHLVGRWRAIEEVFRKQIVKDRPFGRKIRGVELPFEGYEELTMALEYVCDGCQEEVQAGEKVHYHRRTGRTYCTRCVPDPSVPHDLRGPVPERA